MGEHFFNLCLLNLLYLNCAYVLDTSQQGFNSGPTLHACVGLLYHKCLCDTQCVITFSEDTFFVGGGNYKMLEAAIFDMCYNCWKLKMIHRTLQFSMLNF